VSVQRPADDIAYWLEMAEDAAWADWFRAVAELPGNPLDARLSELDGVATFSLGAVDIGLFNRSIGFGMDRSATEADVDAAIAALTDAGRTSWVIQPGPLARPSALPSWLERRSLRPGRQWAKTWRDTAEPPETATSLRIEEVGAERRDDFGGIVEAAFELPDELAPLGRVVVGRRGWHTYLAFDEGVAVGAAALFVIGAVGWLGFGSTLASHRGRGGQSAMFARRIADAGALGVRLLITETGEDTPKESNPSYRNMLRTGFRLGYLRRNWLNPAPAS
jgi:hypothetical protein